MKRLRYQRPWLYPEQQAALFHQQRYGIVEASTKAGKTLGALVWLTEQAMRGKAGWNYWWTAPVYSQVKIAFRRLHRGLPQKLHTSNESDLTITLANQAVVWFKSGERPDNLYGEDVYAAVVDEASRLREESWHAIRSTLTATRGPVRIIGNVKGRRNWAYRMARKAEAGEAGMHYAKLTAYDAIRARVLATEEVEDAKAQLPESVFRELYLAEPADDEGCPFNAAAVRACIGSLSSQPPACWGWDLAKSVDWTVGIALDSAGAVCRFERWQQVPWEETERRIVEATGSTVALIDSTGVGDPIVERLQKRLPNVEGQKFTPASKQQLMEGLAVAIQARELSFPEGPITAELLAFEYHYSRTGVRYSAPEGMHDDCVDALALAVRRRTRPSEDVWSLADAWGPVEELLR